MCVIKNKNTKYVECSSRAKAKSPSWSTLALWESCLRTAEQTKPVTA